jgi:uncharacterized protein DUF2786
LVQARVATRALGRDTVGIMAARNKPPSRRGRPIVALDEGAGACAVLAQAVQAAHDGGARAVEAGIDQLATAPVDEVDTALGTAGDRVLSALFARGWQPADVVRATDPVHRPWVASLLRRGMRRYPASRVAESWTGQLDALPHDAPPSNRHDAIRASVEVLGILNYLPDLPLLMPPPGVARAGSAPAGANTRMLGKIRALLAKAESTTFPSEAESYSMKAEQLIAAHRIDHALIAGEIVNPDDPLGVRVTVDHPYAEAKALLLHVVAAANGCRAVWSAENGFSTVFGFEDELEAVKLLYASLLVQGTAAMVREGSARHDTPARTKTFRQSFMHAYAIRIGDRLHETASRANDAAAASSDRLLPVLASRDRTVRDQVERLFGHVESKGRSIRIDSRHGWRSGASFADRAFLDGQRRRDRRGGSRQP